MGRQNPPPTLTDVIDARILSALSGMNCVSLGTIESFDPTDQTATISVNYKKVIKDVVTTEDGTSTQDEIVEYRPLVKCPVMVLSGGASSLTLPIAKGDACILLFCDREIDSWFTNGSVTAPASSRMHDLNDGIAVVGIRSMANPISSYETNKIKMSFGGAYITIDSSGNVAISSGGSVSVEGANVTISGSTKVEINP